MECFGLQVLFIVRSNLEFSDCDQALYFFQLEDALIGPAMSRNNFSSEYNSKVILMYFDF